VSEQLDFKQSRYQREEPNRAWSVGVCAALAAKSEWRHPRSC